MITTTTYTAAQMTTAKNLVGTEINELEFINCLVSENGKTYFHVIHLNGAERMIEITEL